MNKTKNELKHCQSCGGFKETMPGWPEHEEDIQSCLCDCESDRRDRRERAQRRNATVDEP